MILAIQVLHDATNILGQCAAVVMVVIELRRMQLKRRSRFRAGKALHRPHVMARKRRPRQEHVFPLLDTSGDVVLVVDGRTAR